MGLIGLLLSQTNRLHWQLWAFFSIILLGILVFILFFSNTLLSTPVFEGTPTFYKIVVLVDAVLSSISALFGLISYNSSTGSGGSGGDVGGGGGGGSNSGGGGGGGANVNIDIQFGNEGDQFDPSNFSYSVDNNGGNN